MKSAKRITVLLVDDHTVVRQGLRRILEDEGDIEVVGEADSGGLAVEMTATLHPNVVVMDIAMPKSNGLEATRRICATIPDAKVLILSAHGDDAYVEAVMAMGAVGYLIKQTSAQCLAEAIREVWQGNTYFSTGIARRFSKRHEKILDRHGRARKPVASLTPREMAVLQRIAEGDANKQIAAELGISIKTVEKHRDNLMRKLAIHDTAGLTRYAIAAGIIESSIQVTIV
ncbi:MAG: response regulator transcription factor [Lentisphaerae bacterium]|nr:response regulator transcription factor [Lentisphaerota bacterium]